MNASIVTACIPTLKRVFVELKPGLTLAVISEDLELSESRHASQSHWGSLAGSRSGVVVTRVSAGMASAGNHQRKDSQKWLREDKKRTILKTVDIKTEYEGGPDVLG